MAPYSDWNYPTHIRFGAGRIAELANACFTIGITRPLLITDQKLAELSMVRECITANEATNLPTGLFSDVKSNPTGKTVEKGVTAYREGNHDGIITLGGGSAMDVGKAVALLAGQTIPLWEFEDFDTSQMRELCLTIGFMVSKSGGEVLADQSILSKINASNIP